MKGPVFPIGNVLREWTPPMRQTVLEPICETLAAGTGTAHRRFGVRLRGEIAFQYSRLPLIAMCDDDAPTPGDTMQLVISFTDAIEKIEAWADRCGLDALDTDAEDAAARCGWPDENGNGWNPPWDILRMKKPAWWGTGQDPSETA